MRKLKSSSQVNKQLHNYHPVYQSTAPDLKPHNDLLIVKQQLNKEKQDSYFFFKIIFMQFSLRIVLDTCTGNTALFIVCELPLHPQFIIIIVVENIERCSCSCMFSQESFRKNPEVNLNSSSSPPKFVWYPCRCSQRGFAYYELCVDLKVTPTLTAVVVRSNQGKKG